MSFKILLINRTFAIKINIMTKKALKATPIRNTTRTHRQVFVLNDDENKVLNRYIAKYKVRNKSKLIRETLMMAIIRKMEQDHPRLFD